MQPIRKGDLWRHDDGSVIQITSKPRPFGVGGEVFTVQQIDPARDAVCYITRKTLTRVYTHLF